MHWLISLNLHSIMVKRCQTTEASNSCTCHCRCQTTEVSKSCTCHQMSAYWCLRMVQMSVDVKHQIFQTHLHIIRCQTKEVLNSCICLNNYNQLNIYMPFRYTSDDLLDEMYPPDGGAYHANGAQTPVNINGGAPTTGYTAMYGRTTPNGRNTPQNTASPSMKVIYPKNRPASCSRGVRRPASHVNVSIQVCIIYKLF